MIALLCICVLMLSVVITLQLTTLLALRHDPEADAIEGELARLTHKG